MSSLLCIQRRDYSSNAPCASLHGGAPFPTPSDRPHRRGGGNPLSRSQMNSSQWQRSGVIVSKFRMAQPTRLAPPSSWRPWLIKPRWLGRMNFLARSRGGQLPRMNLYQIETTGFRAGEQIRYGRSLDCAREPFLAGGLATVKTLRQIHSDERLIHSSSVRSTGDCPQHWCGMLG